MLQALIERYRRRQKEKFLDMPGQFGAGYAFIGVGSHSIQNLYPVLQYMGLKIKLVHSRTLLNAEKMAARFPGARGTNTLDLILNDHSIKGVFICSKADQQESLVRACLMAGKHVWVEKPAARNSAELLSLVKVASENSLYACMGVQRRHAPLFEVMKPRTANALHYSMRYSTGLYPEGDVFTELFIHPVDLLVHLWGPAEIINVTPVKSGGGITIFLQLKHANGTIGNVELSTLHNWQAANEFLTVNTSGGVWTAEGMSQLNYSPRPARPFGIPIEKVLHRPAVTQTWFNSSRFLPQMQHQPQYVHGFYGELLAFAQAVEGKSVALPQAFRELLPTYDLLDRLRERC